MPVPQDQIHAAANGMTWEAYMELFTRLVAEGRTTGTDQSEALLAYTKLNLAWCGDAAQCNPIIAAMAERTPGVTLRFILRDEHLPIMDRYLTNGGRSIPKLIVWDDATKEELYNWGPRPADAQVLYTDYLATPVDQRNAEAMKEKLHRWYFDDAGVSVQRELLALAKRTVQVKA
jgi:hypothetical protein